MHLTFYTAAYALDGGSTRLYATDERNTEHRVYLPRNVYSDGGSPRQTTGLLYFDDELVPLRSPVEANLLQLLRDSRCEPSPVPRPGWEKLTGPVTVIGDDLERLVRGTPQESLRWMVDSVISYVESDTYGSAGS